MLSTRYLDDPSTMIRATYFAALPVQPPGEVAPSSPIAMGAFDTSPDVVPSVTFAAQRPPTRQRLGRIYVELKVLRNWPVPHFAKPAKNVEKGQVPVLDLDALGVHLSKRAS
jgi:hypothetical protein